MRILKKNKQKTDKSYSKEITVKQGDFEHSLTYNLDNFFLLIHRLIYTGSFEHSKLLLSNNITGVSILTLA